MINIHVPYNAGFVVYWQQCLEVLFSWWLSFEKNGLWEETLLKLTEIKVLKEMLLPWCVRKLEHTVTRPAFIIFDNHNSDNFTGLLATNQGKWPWVGGGRYIFTFCVEVQSLAMTSSLWPMGKRNVPAWLMAMITYSENVVFWSGSFTYDSNLGQDVSSSRKATCRPQTT